MVINISKYANKFQTWEYFLKSNIVICPINKDTVNERILNSYRKLKQTPLYSMQYLVSDAYKSVVINHKITLLLHIIDGIVPDSVINQITAEIRSKYNVQGKIGYGAKVYYICKNNFFYYHRKYRCDILPLLKVNQYQFIQIISDTRNWYSHFLADNKKTNRLYDGAEMLMYFEIIYYAIRLFLVKEIDVNIDENYIREFFYSVHDWILEIKYGKSEPLKSNTYKIIQGIEEMKKITEQLQKNVEEKLSDKVNRI